jgi:bifunctional non-homologous end joining protein LigD
LIRIRTRKGYDWTERTPLIVEAAGKLRATSFVIDGEGLILRPDGVSDFDRLHSRRHDGEVQLLGFDLLELDGIDLRREPLTTRKATLAKIKNPASAAIPACGRTTDSSVCDQS